MSRPPTDPKIKAEIKRVYLSTKLKAGDLAKQFPPLSYRAIHYWIKDENWELERKAQNVIEFAHNPTKALRRVPARAMAKVSNAIDIANDTIEELLAEMQNEVSNASGKAAVANALKNWVEYRERLKPPTIEELATQIASQLADWQLSPTDLVKELRVKWEADKQAHN